MGTINFWLGWLGGLPGARSCVVAWWAVRRRYEVWRETKIEWDPY